MHFAGFLIICTQQSVDALMNVLINVSLFICKLLLITAPPSGLCCVVERWDCVATVFFVDTAHNIIAYIETIWHILKPGGYWMNLGVCVVY